MKSIKKILQYHKYSKDRLQKIPLLLISVLQIAIAPLKYLSKKIYNKIFPNLFSLFLKNQSVKIDNYFFYVRSANDFFSLIAEEQFRNSIPKCEIFIDVGAHVGKYTIMEANKFRKIYAIEPTPTSFEVLKRNIAINDLSEKVIALNRAAFSANQSKDFFINKNDHAQNSLGTESIKKNSVATIKIEALKLDEMIEENDLGKISFIKIDVEGSELEVLKGAVGILEQSKPEIIIEIKANIESVRRVLAQYGYRLNRLDQENWLARIKP